MKTLFLTPIGILVEEEDTLVGKILFSKDIDKAIPIYKRILDGNIDEKIIEEISNYGDSFIVSSPILYDALLEAGFHVELVERSLDLPTILVRAGWAKNLNEAVEIIREAYDRLTRLKLQEDLANKDIMVIHSVSAYEEYTETINIMYERLREWYGAYFPELSDIIRKMESYINLIAKFTSKEEFNREALQKLGYSEDKVNKIIEALQRSVGGTLSNHDLKMIKEYAETAKKVIDTRDRIDQYIREVMETIAPNITAVAGYKLGAKLVTKAGGLSRLAMMPASTIQLLGAEKALFRALRKGAKPPKHGYIFQHPYINQSPRSVRGKIARMMASKIAIAARADAFGGEYIGEELANDLKKKVEELRRSAKKKPKVKKRRRRPR